MDNSKFLTSTEYNTIAVKLLSDFLYETHKEEYDKLLYKLFHITIKDLDTATIEEIKKEQQLKQELINKPITNKPTITNS